MARKRLIQSNTQAQMPRKKTKTTSQSKNALFPSLPLEIFLIIAQNLGLEDISTMMRTCSYMATMLEPILYKRAIAAGTSEYASRFTYAAMEGSASAISKFLKAGARMDGFDDFKVSYKGIFYGSPSWNVSKRHLLNYNFHPLLAAALLGQVDVVSTLITEGMADINFEDDYKSTALMYAITNDHLDVVKVLLAEGADLKGTGKDYQLNSPLIHAGKVGNKKAVKILCEEFQKRSVPGRTISNQGQHACYQACIQGFTDIVKFLILRGVAKVNKLVDGYPLLYHASTRKILTMVKLLVELGAKMENERDTGVVATYVNAWQPDELSIVKYILESGFNVANGQRHACVLWYIAGGYGGLRGYVKNSEILGLLKANGFKKKNCKHNCWSKGKLARESRKLDSYCLQA